jgi:uncharacterized protein (TIGR00730 family)
VERVCVFCGSNVGGDPAYLELARQLGAMFASKGITLVYGGGKVGLMGAVADAVLEAGGRAIGVIPEALKAKEIAHTSLTQLYVTRSMHERKAMMAELADAFVAMPGGMGTWEELFEILTWAQLGQHHKPVVVLDVNGYYDPLFALVERGVDAHFVRQEHAALALRARTVDDVLALLQEPPPPPLPKWLDRDQT